MMCNDKVNAIAIRIFLKELFMEIIAFSVILTHFWVRDAYLTHLISFFFLVLQLPEYHPWILVLPKILSWSTCVHVS